jgi:uncharacterized protein (DUF2236 family)
MDGLARDLLAPPRGMEAITFDRPKGAPALFAQDSVTWRVMKNPVALMIGGVTAVLLELAEPRVRTGVWEHTSFRRDPVGRIRRTGYAALASAYAPADQARALIARVNAMHARVSGVTPDGAAYRADDPELLAWVYATAQFGFVEAYHRYVRKLSSDERDAYYAEAVDVAALWGVRETWRSAAEAEALFQRLRPKLERHEIVFEFLDIMARAPLLPGVAQPLQTLSIRAAIALLPAWARELLGMSSGHAMPLGGETLLRTLGAAAERFAPRDAPPVLACGRMGVGHGFLYR